MLARGFMPLTSNQTLGNAGQITGAWPGHVMAGPHLHFGVMDQTDVFGCAAVP
jgi:hypothetical protein